MQKYNVYKSDKFSDVYIVDSLLVNDSRGCVLKDYQQEWLKDKGLNHELKEVFYTKSKRGVMRAIHFQNTKPQAKLVQCIKGKIHDVIVDLRVDSKTYKEWEMFELSEHNAKSIYVPHGFGHGYLVEEDSIVSYKCDEVFYGEYDDGIMWNDKEISIDWPLHIVENILLSEKDENLVSLKEYEKTDKIFKMY